MDAFSHEPGTDPMEFATRRALPGPPIRSRTGPIVTDVVRPDACRIEVHARERLQVMVCTAGGGVGHIERDGVSRPVVIVPGSVLVHPGYGTTCIGLPPLRGRAVTLVSTRSLPGDVRPDDEALALLRYATGCDVIGGVVACMDALARAGDPCREVRTARTERYVRRLLSLLRAACASAEERARPIALTDVRLMRAVWHVEARIAERLEVPELADAAIMSPYHFAHRFTSAAGISPHRYVVRRRLERSLDLLRDAEGPSLIDVAALCGFGSQQHYTRRFRDAFGTTPGRWRRSRLARV